MGSRTDPLRFSRRELPNGVSFVYQSAPEGAHSFAASYVGPGGWGHDPPGFEGLARVTASLLTSAVGPYDRVELARRLDRAGATLTSQCAPESSEVTIWGPADEDEELVHLLEEAVLRPRFDPADVRRVLRQLGERQLRETSQPASRADRELLRTVFPRGHPYRESGLGDARSLAHLNRRAIERFHRRHYTAEDALLVVTSPTASARAERLVRPRFRSFAERTAPTLTVPPVTRGPPRERRVSLPGRTQVELRIGGPSIARSDPLFPAATLANELLGGRPLLSRLFQAVREKEGLAYHASSDLEAMRWGGFWSAQAGTGAQRWKSVVRILDAELRRLREESVPAKELRLVRESTIGELPLSLESTSEAHELAVDAAYHRLPEDHWQTWPDRLRAVTPADLGHAAERAFGRAGSVTVVAGPLGRT